MLEPARPGLESILEPGDYRYEQHMHFDLPHPWDVPGGNAQSIYLGRRHVVRQPEMDHATCYVNVLRPDPGPILPLPLGKQSFTNMPIVCFVRLPVKFRRG